MNALSSVIGDIITEAGKVEHGAKLFAKYGPPATETEYGMYCGINHINSPGFGVLQKENNQTLYIE